MRISGVFTTRAGQERRFRTGWSARLSRGTGASLLFLAVTGLAVTFGPFHPSVEWGLLLHTAVGAACLLPLGWYCVAHWIDYRRYQLSSVVLLGYLAVAGLVVCLLSGAVVTWQGLFGLRISAAWRQTHLVSTFIVVGAGLTHVAILLLRLARFVPAATRFAIHSVGIAAVAIAATAAMTRLYAGPNYLDEFPADYNYISGKNRPFAPSLAKTSSGGAFDARRLAGSRSCGTAGCHSQIVTEWLPSAHRYAARDPLFQGIQATMAKQNGSESTRYCGGCHDPISLFSGTKNIFVKDLTGLHGYQEGVSCLACHSIRETDIKGNASYTMSQPSEYLWQWEMAGPGRLARDFLIRTYPDEHNRLSKRLFKTPQYCAACHKQFIDAEVNRVGWVQLQNQYDNWANSHWNHKGNARKTVECRECHMPLVDSNDPSSGDSADYNRSSRDRRHRSHRFIAANQLVPALEKLEGWEEQVQLTEQWLQGKRRIPEIEDKWATGPIVKVALDLGPSKRPGIVPIRVVLTSNKVGHDYPTGPLDMIQSWVEIQVLDEDGREIFSSGTRDARGYIAPGTFLFKAEPVDQHGNLIDRHNLWEMVGVRFRRALFPAFSDSVEYQVACSGVVREHEIDSPSGDHRHFEIPRPSRPGRYRVTARLLYRKVDQFLVNYLMGERSGITAPVVEIGRASATIDVPAEGGTSRARLIAASQ
ncbi:MAG: multiheme c-type cytochrome [Vicinamibacterales bacterium]